MIPKLYIVEWKSSAPWADEQMVEQDLIISRVLISLYQNQYIKDTLAFRGGTALNKLFLSPAARYSEDLDFVQLSSAPIGEMLAVIKHIVNPILGKPKWKLNEGRATLIYKFPFEDFVSDTFGKLKIEINTREHFTVFGYKAVEYEISNRWFSGESLVTTYTLEELMGTKLRALFQRKKGRDLFDIWYVLSKNQVDKRKVILAFKEYLKFENKQISRALFEKNIHEKLNSSLFTDDISILLSPEIDWDIEVAVGWLQNSFFPLLPGKPWQGNTKEVEVVH